MVGIVRFAAVYPLVDRIIKFLLANIPSMAAKRKSHFDFTRKRTENRLGRETDRTDFTTYASALIIIVLAPDSNTSVDLTAQR